MLATTTSVGQDTGLLIRIGENEQLLLEPVKLAALQDELKQPGLLIWTKDGQDQWQVLPAERVGMAGSAAASFVTLAHHGSRGSAAGSPPAMPPATTQLTQLVGQVVLRGDGLITPPDNSLLLDGRITIRRRAETRAVAPFPADELQISRDDKPFLRLRLDDGEHTLRWSEISGLRQELTNGLPPGEYTLRIKRAGTSARFRVAMPALSTEVLGRADEIRALSGQGDDSLYLQVAVESLLAYRDEHGSSQPLLVDAFELLDSRGFQPLRTPHLRRLYADLRSRLEGEKPQRREDTGATGIKSIDEARRAIAEGQWDAAARKLDAVADSADKREKALSTLYRAAIFAESGQATGDAAKVLYLEAIELLRDGAAADQLRANNNFAMFLLNRCQDRIYNHAFQMASGVQNPLMSALVDWYGAREYLHAALTAAVKVNASEVAAVRVNLARLYSTLADLLRVLQSEDGSAAVTQLTALAETWAARLAVESAGYASTDPVVRAVSHEIRAHLAFRRSEFDVCLKNAEAALTGYLESGSLAGCESIYRLRGLLRCPVENRGDFEGAARLALNDLKISQTLAELLRQRMPVDGAGLSSAGFLARRAYVNEKMVELLVDLGQTTEALCVAELAKARGLQDVLTTGRNRTSARLDHTAIASRDVLSDWPAGTAALEYFVGSEKTWLFVISPAGQVAAYVIRDESGEPLASRDLVARVHRMISGLDQLGPAEGRRIAAAAASGNLRFDETWQHELHWFYRTLIPEESRSRLDGSTLVVIVPHHILHYFPFAALVTDVDVTAADPARMPLPKFFVESPFCIVYAPSLVTWKLLRQRENRALDQVRILGIANFGGRAGNLDGVNVEITNMRSIFGGRIVQLVSDREATESRAQTLLGQPGILSISTHGQKVPDRPLEAFLMCYPDERHDGLLRAAEIYSLDVQADLILLNACYGGFADRSPLPGDDLFGVQRALLHSGARTVVSGMWDIYDATAPDIMNDFWKKIAAGTAAPQALAEAQRNYLKLWREFPQQPLRFLTHPYYWAVFTVAGDDRTGGVNRQ